MARGKGRQPVRVASGGDYGDRTAMVQQQQAAPLPQVAPQTQQGNNPMTGQGAPQPRPQRPSGPVSYGSAGVFSPTARPGEPMTAGLEQKPVLADNPYLQLQAIAAGPYSTPWLRDLVNRMRSA